MSGPRLLLLTSHPPGGHGVGQIYLRSLCGLLPPRSVAVAALLGGGDRWTPAGEMDLSDTLRLERRYESVFRPWRGPAGEAVALAGVHGRLAPQARRAVDAVANWARDRRIEHVMAVLDGPTTMLMAAPLAERLDADLRTLVWDVPEHVLPSFGHTSWSARPLRRGFDAALWRSTGVAVMSAAMSRRFAGEYGARCTVLHQPIDPEWTDSRRDARDRGGDDFVIGFAGSVTARDELELLCRALDSAHWMVAGRRVRLRVYGLRYVCQAQTARWIEYRGYVPETADVVGGLAECDVLFLPQPFGPQGRAFSEYSFPTKFTTYVAAGRPLLILTPEWSALAEFCREHDLPVVCTELREAAVLDHLRRLATDGDHVAQVERQLAAVATTVFSRRLASELVREWLASDDSGSGRAAPTGGLRVGQQAIAS